MTNVSNVASFGLATGRWIRVGNVVHVIVDVDVDPTLGAPTRTIYAMSLPIASNLGGTTDCIGAGTCDNGGAAAGSIASIQISGDGINDRAEGIFQAVVTTNYTTRNVFSYLVI